MKDYKAEGISVRDGKQVHGYLLWNPEMTKFYIAQHQEYNQDVVDLDKIEIYSDTIVFGNGIRKNYLFQGRKVESPHEFLEGFFFMDASEKKSYIGRYDKKGKLFYNEVKPRTVGIYTGKEDIYGKKMFSSDMVVFHTPYSEISGMVVIYNGHFYVRLRNSTLKPLRMYDRYEKVI